MLIKEILHYFIFRLYVKITKNGTFSYQVQENSNRSVNICFSGIEHCKLEQLSIFFLRFISKGIICGILDGIFKLLSLLESMCDFINIIKPPLFSAISGIYRLMILICKLIIGKRFI